MKNKQTTTYKWAYLPFVFSSATILATQVMAAPRASQQYQDARQVSSANHEYVGGKTQIGFGVTDDGDVSVDLNQVLMETENSSTSAGLWAGYKLKGDDKGITGRGVQVNHNWVSRDGSDRATHINKVFGAYDRNEGGHAKATVGYGQENESLFWEGHVSKGLTDKKGSRLINGKTVSDVAYDYGVGGSVGTFLKGSNMRVRAGVDHEWGDNLGEGESTAKNTTLSAGIEKFFQGTPHSLGLDVAASKRSGGHENESEDSEDSDVSGKLSYRYDFGGASIYQPDRRYRRVRVEVPGKGVAPRYAKKAQYKRVPTYKTVTTYGKKTIRTPYKQLVKSTMELEGETFFKLNSSKLIPSAKTRLQQIAAQIRKNGYKGAIRITGNTCGLGDAAYDQRLSEQRANAVKNFLIQSGFNADHLIARGLGKGHPKYPNTDDQGFKNRRVDIEYVTERKAYKTGYRTEQKTVKTGTRRVATGFKNVPAGHKNVLIDSGRAGSPRVIWKTEVIPSSPAWIKRALHNNIRHNTAVNTYQTTAGSGTGGGDNIVNAANDTVTVCSANQSISIDVLSNDDGDATITRVVTQPANGTATIANGEIVYTADAGFSGTDQFTYEVRDPHGNTATATVTVTVCAAGGSVNAGDDTASTDQGQAVTIDVLSNDDSDAEITRVVNQPLHGTASLVNGQIVYTPAAGFSGIDRFTYEVTDPQGNTSTATVTVTVTAQGGGGVNAGDDTASTNQGQAVTIDVLGNDDSDAILTGTLTQPANGTATISNGQIVYTPNAGFTGTDHFTYEVIDPQGNTTTANVTVTVNAQGGAGVDAADDSASTDCSAVTINVLDNDSGSGTLNIVGVGSASLGSAVISGNTIVYTPTASCATGNTGTDTFTYTITDGSGNSDTATVTVDVNGTGGGCHTNCIKAEPDDTITDENQSVTIDVLANDAGEGLSIVSVDSPANGTTEQVGNSIKYTPNAGFTGTDSFWYDIKDSKGNLDAARVYIYVGSDD
ncbi:MAG TPA: OmpA family protein [Leucothrix sp.]|nr:OmpA family protein [Leucothrix sp.]